MPQNKLFVDKIVCNLKKLKIKLFSIMSQSQIFIKIILNKKLKEIFLNKIISNSLKINN